MKSFRKIISITITLTFLLNIFYAAGSTAFAVKTKKQKSGVISSQNSDYTYNILSDGTIEINSYSGSETNLSVPSKLDNYTITGISSHAFWDIETLETVSLPSTLEYISSGGFGSCEHISSLIINNGIKNIGTDAFRYCNSLTTVTLPDSLVKLGSSAFRKCDALETVKIGKNLSVIGDNPFSQCKSLKSITVSDSNSDCYSKDGVLYDKNDILIAFPNSYPFPTLDWTYTVPDGTKGIANMAFYECYNLDGVILPDSVVSIGDEAFSSANMDNVTLSQNLAEIGNEAFYSNKIKELSFGSKLTRIGDNAFGRNSKMQQVTIPEGVSDIGAAPFMACPALTDIMVSEDNPDYKDIDGVLFNKDATEILNYPQGKTADSYTIPDSVSIIGKYAFFEIKKLTNIKYSDNIREINDYAFDFCTNLSGELDFENVIKVGLFAFANCVKVTKITFGSQLSELGNFAFMYTNGLEGVYFKGNAPRGESLNTLFYLTDEKSRNIYYPDGDPTWSDRYMENANWHADYKINFYTWGTPVVDKVAISNCQIILSEDSYEYTGNSIKPSVTVKYDGTTRENGIDYRLEYRDNTNAGTGRVRVYGMGFFSGYVDKPFYISKLSQTLTASLSPNTLKTGDTSQIKASGIGTITYSGYNDSVVSVNSLGVVKAIGSGKTRITVKAEGNQNYYSDTKTLDVNVEGNPVNKKYTISDLTYSFGNNEKAFHYDEKLDKNGNYYIPKERYKMFYSDEEIDTYYRIFGVWEGNCYGMATTSAMFNTDSSTLKLSDFNRSKVNEIKYNDYNSKITLDATELIEAMLLSQLTDECYYAAEKRRNKLTALVNEVKKCDNGAPPVEIGFGIPYVAGHALLGYKYEQVSSTSAKLHVYDCNYPKTDRYIEITTDTNGNPTEWYYCLNDVIDTGSEIVYKDSGGNRIECYIKFNLFDEFESVWEKRNTHRDTTYNKMFTESDNFTITNSNGKTVAKMENGKFESTQGDICEVNLADVKTDTHIISMPIDKYRVHNSDKGNFEIDVINVEQSVHVKTEADDVEFFVDDSQSADIAEVYGQSGEAYEVTVKSEQDSSNDKKTVTYNGKCIDDEVNVGCSYGDYCTSNYSNSGISVNNKKTNLIGVNDIDLAEDKNYSISLSDTSYVYDGTNKRPDVTVKSKNGYELTEGADYTVVYSGDVEAGTATATAYGINGYIGKLEAAYKIESTDINNCSISLPEEEFTYDGTAKTPEPVIYNGTMLLKQDKDYTVTYLNNISSGTALAKIEGIGSYFGTVTKNFTIKSSSIEPVEETTAPATPSVYTSPVDNPTEKPTTVPITTEPIYKPTQPATEEPDDDPDEPYTPPVIRSKKSNPIKVSAKTKTIKASKLKKRKQKTKSFSIRNAAGSIKVKLFKAGTSSKIYNKIKVNKNGSVTFRKGKYKKGLYKIRIRVTAKGNSRYKSKTISKTAKVRIK